MLYNCFVVPYLRYGNIVWGRAAATHIMRLFILQKRAIRIISGAEFLAHTNQLFHDNHTLKLQDLNTYLCALFVYKIYHNMFPSAFSTPFRITPLVHPHITRAISFNTASIPYCRTSIRQKSLAIIAPNVYNSNLCRHDNIINTHSFTHFKKIIANKIIESYNYDE